MTAQILIADDERSSRELLSSALKSKGYHPISFESGTQLLEHLDQYQPDLILLDVMMPDLDGYQVCQRLRSQQQTKHTPILIVTAMESLESKMKGFDAGADDYLTKPFEVEELQARVEVWLRRATKPGTSEHGVESKSIAVFSLRGGTGVSSIAANLSAGLASIWNHPTALVDLSLVSGHSALLMNTPIVNSWGDLAGFKEEEITPDVLNQVMLSHHSGVRILAAPKNAQDAERITPALVNRVIQLLSTQYEYLIFDLPHNFDAISLVGLDFADQIIYILVPELAAISSSSTALKVFSDLDYPESKIFLLLNWIFERRGLAKEDIEKALGEKVDLVLPFVGQELVSAINLGQPPVLKNPEESIGALFEDLAFYFSKKAHRSKKPADPSDAFLRIYSRYKQRKR